jgi:SAM-dependent methyltransferase
MPEVQRHYDQLLAAHYGWMSGVSFPEKVAEQQQLLASLGVTGQERGLAVDLGCGPGYQAVALARLGFDTVLAVDTSAGLLAEFAAAKGEWPVREVYADIRALKTLVPAGTARAVACMGDTLTHLDTRADVSALFSDAHAALMPGGRLVITYRDLSEPVDGLDRIIPVRSDDQRIMTCVLDYAPEAVTVNDRVHVREADGWRLHKSSYRKLRLPVGDLVSELQQTGFAIEHSGPAGRLTAIAAART